MIDPARSLRWLRATLLAAALTSACQLPTATGSGSNGNASGNDVFLWVASDRDAYVSCGAAGPPCSEANLNYGGAGFLAVARSAIEFRKIYVHFPLPVLPVGTTVEEAWFEMYHPGRNEDGTTDDIRIPFGRASAPWNVADITLANEPNRQLTGGEYSLRLNSQNWSGSPDISTLVRAWYADPASNHGFYVYWDQLNPGVHKSFYSNNDVRRRANDLGLSPRLLLRVRLPQGQAATAIAPGPLTANNDLPFNGQAVTVLLLSTGTDWPAAWAVRRGT